MTFYDDLHDALIIEQEAQKRVINYYNNTYKSNSFRLGRTQNSKNYKYLKYDFEILPCNNHYSILFEVKNDKLTKYTGNFFIEYLNNNGSDSGISITESHYHILVNDDIYYMISTYNILKLIKSLKNTNKIFTKESKEGSSGYLIKEEIIKSLSTAI